MGSLHVQDKLGEAVPPKKKHWILWSLTVFLVLPAVIASMSDVSKTVEPASAARSLAPLQEQKEIVSNWRYDERKVGIDDVSMKSATVKSRESLSLGFPYHGDNYGHITVRMKGKKRDVLFEIDKGQFVGGYSGMAIKAKFDNGKTTMFSALEPDDNSTGLMFIINSKGFVNALRSANKLKIETRLFREGNQVLEFDVSGLDMSKLN